MSKRAFHPLLEGVRDWPYSIKGILDIVDCGDCEEFEGYPSWAVGALEITKHKEPILIGIEGCVLQAAECDIDSGKTVMVYLSLEKDKYSSYAQDGKMYEEQIYTITKIKNT